MDEHQHHQPWNVDASTKATWRNSTNCEWKEFHFLDMPQPPPLKMKQPSPNLMKTTKVAIMVPTIVVIDLMDILALQWATFCILGRIVHGYNTKVLSLRHCSWRGIECDVVDVEGVFIVRGQLIACDPREIVLYDDLGEDRFGSLILYCPNDISTIMNIQKWPLS